MSRSKEPLRIAIDLDGVVCDFNQGFAALLNKYEPGIVPDDFVFSSWDWPNSIRPGLEKIGWALVRKTNDFWLGLRSYEQAVDDLSAFLFNIENVDVYFVTSKVPSAGTTSLAQCNMWLRDRWLRHDETAVIIKPRNRTKADIYRALDIRYSIDDYTKNVEEALEVEGHKPFLLSQPWNTAATHLDGLRVPSLKDYLDFIFSEVTR